MSKRLSTAWVYSGIWGVITRWFRVPAGPPPLPAEPREQLDSFRPSEGFLRYLKFQFWLALLVIDAAILVGWLILFYELPTTALILSPVAFAVAVFPDVVAYVAIHLKVDTTWYVMTSRSLRIRRGIWTIHETTITFENIQNVRVHQGPLQRYYGIANVIVETAGGGAKKSGEGADSDASHRGLIEGIANPQSIRDKIMDIVMRSRAAGLGDETEAHPEASTSWSPAHIAVLREIRDSLL
jgi:membrane protein YdbS with pleckstrin-like domain